MTLTSFEPATGQVLWTDEAGDAAAEVAAARRAADKAERERRARSAAQGFEPGTTDPREMLTKTPAFCFCMTELPIPTWTAVASL